MGKIGEPFEHEIEYVPVENPVPQHEGVPEYAPEKPAVEEPEEVPA